MDELLVTHNDPAHGLRDSQSRCLLGCTDPAHAGVRIRADQGPSHLVAESRQSMARVLGSRSNLAEEIATT
ncbi:hypothetical protein WJX82_003000 [Trebouxia sp. C0006]